MNRSHLRDEEFFYVSYDQDGKVETNSSQKVQKGWSSRKVHYTREDNVKRSTYKSKDVFEDPQWRVTQADVKNLDPNRNIVLKRLIKCYSKKVQNRPPFFSNQKTSLNKSNPKQVPACILQIDLFPPSHYKSLFITQDYQENGLYHVLINEQGRWQTDVVDDFIPVYEDTEEPIWGLDLNHPWQIILIKFWAKRKRSYEEIRDGTPFQFIECFSNSNWKYMNLAKESYNYLSKYVGKSEVGKFVVKTKSDEAVADAGLVPNSAGYQIINLQYADPKYKQSKYKPADKEYVVTIRSTLKNRWVGDLSVIDEKINNTYKSKICPIRLERDFLMNGRDFINLFSVAYVASKREKQDCYSNYYLLNIPAYRKSAVYLEFDLDADQGSFLDIVIKQFSSNKVQAGQASRIEMAQQKSTIDLNRSRLLERYLRLKYVLAYDMSSSSAKSLLKSQDKGYAIPKYYEFEIQSTTGYNSGDCHFIQPKPGRYVLKIKAENNPHMKEKDTRFVIHYCSNEHFVMKQIQMSKPQSSSFARQTFASILPKRGYTTLDKKLENQQIGLGNTFDALGYGYIGVRSKDTNQYTILLDVDPVALKNGGYRLKNQYKNMKQPFGIVVPPGKSNILLLKRDPLQKSYAWPPPGISIFRKRGSEQNYL